MYKLFYTKNGFGISLLLANGRVFVVHEDGVHCGIYTSIDTIPTPLYKPDKSIETIPRVTAMSGVRRLMRTIVAGKHNNTSVKGLVTLLNQQ
jgi:hypothetical protein